jgi:hypothetical protein
LAECSFKKRLYPLILIYVYFFFTFYRSNGDSFFRASRVLVEAGSPCDTADGVPKTRGVFGKQVYQPNVSTNTR